MSVRAPEQRSRAMHLQINCETVSSNRAEQPVQLDKAPKNPGLGWVVVGLLFFVLGCYLLTSPGRIDLIDGQVRFDVAYNWLTQGRPVLHDPWVGPIKGVSGVRGELYSNYGAPASLLAMPLVWLGLHTRHVDLQTVQFLFSLTSPLVGALIGPFVFLLYIELGVTNRSALFWTGVTMFATMLWPGSCTTLDNAQNALFAIVAAILGF